MVSMTSKTIDTADYAAEYAEKILSGEIVASKKVKLLCQRHLNDLEKSKDPDYPYEYSIEKANRPIMFIERFCKHSIGKFAGLPLILALWQKFIICCIFGWVHKETGYRRFRTILVMIARKNGKSTLASAIALYLLMKDKEYGARVYTLANKRDQAKLVFEESKRMVRQSPALRKRTRIIRDKIYFDRMNAELEPLASDSKKLDGLNTHGAIFDEIHEYKDSKLMNVIESSIDAREQPIIFDITTAGFVMDGPLMNLYETADKLLNNTIEYDDFFPYIAEIDKEDDWEEESCWIKANPNLGESLSIEKLRTSIHGMKMKKEINEIKTKRFNIFVNSAEKWLEWDIIKRNNGTFDESELQGQMCIGGADLSSTTDITSVNLEFPQEDGSIKVIHHSFIPEAKLLNNEDRANYERWRDMGLLTVLDGEVIDYDFITQWFVKHAATYHIQEICYDPYNATQWYTQMAGLGFEMVKVQQGFKSMNQSMKDYERLLIQGKVNYNYDLMFQWYLSNTKTLKDSTGNIKPEKANRYARIDGVAAALTAHFRAMVYMNQADLNERILNDEFTL
ncbi:terminase large subunit [Fictibacillus aquaticus]|uniref:Terminase n=1 Tax=Fictibacillus aquaticus TaxID=2021314 RepID=A0A235F9C5_9BACL|nr:terminase TerL endonuclease subunit [Fictibacillus aquaticus]OYD57878.1 terminase [Fictibacillus aquaticus]